MEKDQKILQEIKGQNQKMLEYLVKQGQDNNTRFNTIDEKLNAMNNEMNSVKNAVVDNGLNIKELKVELKELRQTVDTAAINHEQRIRKLEERVGV